MRRKDLCLFHNGRNSLLIQYRYQCFAYSELFNGFNGIKLRIRPEGLSRIGMQRMLNFIAQLAENFVRNVRRILSDEINTDSLRTDQLYNLPDFFEQRRRRHIEKKMRFIKEKNHSRFCHVSGFRQCLKKFRQHPQQEGGIHPRVPDQFLTVQNLNHAAACIVRCQPVGDGKCRLSEELICALRLQCHQGPLDGSQTCLCDVPIF